MKTRVQPATNGHAATMPRARMSGSQRLAVELATWLTESDLLVLGTLPAQLAEQSAGRKPKAGEPRFLVVPSRHGRQEAGSARVLVHWPVRAQLPPTASTGLLPPVKVSGAEIAQRSATTRDFAREGLAWLGSQTRTEVLDFIVAAAAAGPPERRQAPRAAVRLAVDRESRVSAGLHELREALRERLPVGITPGGPVALIDAVARIDTDAFFIRGRVGIGRSRLLRMTAVSPEGSRTELLERAYWYELAAPADQAGDHAWRGFTVFFTCAPSARPGGWLIELETRSGDELEVGAPRVAGEASDVVRIILEDLSVEPLPATRLRTTQIVPAVRRLQRARRRAATLETVKQFGSAPTAPAVSVVVPLYRRIDLVEHQLTQFADDPGMRSVDLIYVLDSPELEDELLTAARRLYPLFRQPFRVAVISANVGFAGANNLGASIARGRLLLLLNSDVFPERPGWLDAMVRFHDSLPNPGAVGPKLLYEDDTLQHAGMYFERLGDEQPWNNEHYFKGMHRDLPAAAASRPVPAVTGACLMVSRDLYTRLGGLSGDYLQGDFEDSEFCLRLLEAGRQNWYFADVALYHLEASSYDPDRRRLHDGFNRWLHSHLWADRLSTVGSFRTSHVAAAPQATIAVVEAGGEVAAGTRSGS